MQILARFLHGEKNALRRKNVFLAEKNVNITTCFLSRLCYNGFNNKGVRQMNLDILISKAEEVIKVLDSFEPYDDALWITNLDAEDVDKAINELRQALAESKGE